MDLQESLIPGLLDDVAKQCLALVPRESIQTLACVCKLWRRWVQSTEFLTERRLAGTAEEWLYMLTSDLKDRWTCWKAFDPHSRKWHSLPPMPGPARAAFGYVVMETRLLVIAGLVKAKNCAIASADVFQYDETLNRWDTLPSMKVARYEFACEIINGLVYAAGGTGANGDRLSSVEVYDPRRQEWTLIESLRSPRWGCFGCQFEGKLHVLGGRSRFSIGYAKQIDVYDPTSCTWETMKSGCAMIIANAVLSNKLICMEWKNQRELAIFDAANKTWSRVPVPFPRSFNIDFRFGSLNGKLLLFSKQQLSYYSTLVFDPNADSQFQWQNADVVPLGCCLACVTFSF